MRLGIDAREIQDGVYTGIGRALVNFLNYFASSNNDDSLILFTSKLIKLDFGTKSKNIVIPQNNTFYWDQIDLPKAIKKENLEIFYSPYYKIPIAAKCIVVSAIFDLMYLVFDEYKKELSPLKKLYYSTFGKFYARKSDKILTCSEYSKQDIIRIYGVTPKKIKIIPLSISNIYHVENDKSRIESVKSRYGIQGRYIYYVGNFKPHKNVKNIIVAFRKILPKFKDLKLVLAGPKTHSFEEYKTLTKELSISDNVIFPGKIMEDAEPHLLYNGAEVFVFPSFYEGFGIPPIEAMACGTPVVASNLTSIPEVVGNAGLLINPYDPDEIASASENIMKNKNLRNSLVEKGLKRAELFHENNIARKNYEFFKSLLISSS